VFGLLCEVLQPEDVELLDEGLLARASKLFLKDLHQASGNSLFQVWGAHAEII